MSVDTGEGIMTPEQQELAPIAWNESVWFSDIDDTLIDTMAASIPGSEGIHLTFAAHCGEDKAVEMQSNFNAIFQHMIDGYRVRSEADWEHIDGGKQGFDDLVESVAAVQTQVKDNYGHIKKWSREVFIKLAADRAGVAVTPELVHEAADAYWVTLTEKIEIFPDAIELANTIRQHGRPLFLVTSSDARLKMQPDGQFMYDPQYSEALKRQRIELLRARGLQFNTVSIGDPEDKPHPDFFTKAIKMAETELGQPIDTSKAIMLGDSFAGDLQTPKEQLGFGFVVLRESNRTDPVVDDAHQLTTGSISVASSYLS